MKIEARNNALVLVSENEAESQLIDKTFGKDVADDGLIAKGIVEARLSDGYGEHYLLVKKD